ncbi:retrovirus-related pol polyprotein from transposon TNT 1-94 [Tanacetum coccineum]
MFNHPTIKGNSQVNDNKIDFLVQQYEQFTILEEESIDSGFARFNTIITSLKALDEGFSSKNYVRKFLMALHPKWRAKVTAIEESKDLSSLALDELISNLKVHKVVMEKDSEIYRGKKERVKSISLKAKKEASDDETLTSGSNDEEYAMAVRNFKKFFRRKGKFVRQPREEKRSYSTKSIAFIGGSWSDSENDAEDKTNNETCLMAQSSNEVTLNSYYYSDNASSLDNGKLKLENARLKETQVKFVKFDKSANTLIEMLNNQKLSSFKIGLGFDSSKASTSGTKPINFVGSSAETALDGSTIKAHGSTIPGSVDPSEAIENNTKVVNNINKEDESIEVDEVVIIKDSKNHPLEQVIEPKNVNEALGDESWVIAMQEELNQFVANDVWDLVPLPMSQTFIGTKWDFKNKLDENGIVSRNKARLVAQGYNQQEGIDYDETYAPVARLESIRILLAIACANDFKLYQMDVKSICLYSDAWGLDELEKNLEQIPPYNSTLPALDDVRNLNPSKNHLENIYSAIGNRDHTQAIIALMLYCLENIQPFNLAYSIIRRMYYSRDIRDKVLPYGMILTRLFKNLKENMVDHSFDERYILVPRKMSSFLEKQPKKPPPKRTRNVGKSKRVQLITSSSSDLPPSDNGELPSTKLSPGSYCRALPNCANMSQDQRETRGMFKNLARALHKFAKMLKKGCR